MANRCHNVWPTNRPADWLSDGVQKLLEWLFATKKKNWGTDHPIFIQLSMNKTILQNLFSRGQRNMKISFIFLCARRGGETRYKSLMIINYINFWNASVPQEISSFFRLSSAESTTLKHIPINSICKRCQVTRLESLYLRIYMFFYHLNISDDLKS